jgi:hypothetical protein
LLERQRATTYDGAMHGEQPLITIDIDGVLSRPPFGFNPGSGRNKRRDKVGRWNILWPLERLRYVGRRPMLGARDGLQRLSGDYRCEVLSARGAAAERYTRGWIQSRLGVALPLNLRPHWRESSAQFKARVAPSLGSTIHIEDDPHTARWLAELIPHVLLVDWPRNEWLEGDNIHRIASIAEAPELVAGLLSTDR